MVIGEALSQTLAEKIIFLDLPPGTHLTEDGVCSEYAVSRSPVREAFRALEADGLVTRLARRGVRVSLVGRKDVEDVFACATVLEGLGAREATQAATEADIARMFLVRDDVARAIKRRELRRFFDASASLSQIIREAGGNASLQRIAAGIEKQALRYRYLAVSKSKALLETLALGHNEVLAAIAARKPAMAERAAQQAVRRSLTFIFDVMENSHGGTRGLEVP